MLVIYSITIDIFLKLNNNFKIKSFRLHLKKLIVINILKYTWFQFSPTIQYAFDSQVHFPSRVLLKLAMNRFIFMTGLFPNYIANERGKEIDGMKIDVSISCTFYPLTIPMTSILQAFIYFHIYET